MVGAVRILVWEVVCSMALYFILVLEALLHEFRTSVQWELLYVDDLKCIHKLKAWKTDLGGKWLLVNT